MVTSPQYVFAQSWAITGFVVQKETQFKVSAGLAAHWELETNTQQMKGNWDALTNIIEVPLTLLLAHPVPEPDAMARALAAI